MYSKFILLISVLSFFFNFIWEWFQCGPFFIHRGSQATPISMIMATLGDVILTYLILLFTYSFTKRQEEFIHKLPRFKSIIYLEIFSFLVAVGVEKFALATNRWSYTEINQLIPIIGVSVLPVLQLMLLSPIVLFLTTMYFKKSQLKWEN